MEKIVLDTCVFLRFFLGQKGRDSVENLLKQIEAKKFSGHISNKNK